MKTKAFTLAEVLIVLGIIGIVAALTIPTLMQQIQDNEFKNAAKVAYSKSSQVVSQIVNDYGDIYSNFGPEHPIKFKAEFMKYFKVIKDCGMANCVPTLITSDIYKTLIGGKGD